MHKNLMAFKNFVSIACFLALIGCSATKDQALYEQKPGFYAYCIGGVENEPSLEHSGNVFIAPASCQKTITALLSYRELGSDYQYETKLISSKNTTAIKFSGDPTLTSENLIALLNPLKGKNLRVLYLDGSAFNTPYYSNNIMRDDVASSYSTSVAAINLDKNLVNITVTPGEFTKQAKIENDADYEIIAEVITSDQKTAIKLEWQKNKLRVSGTINITDSFVGKISPENHEGFILKKIKRLLKTSGIKGYGVFVKDQTNLDAKNVVASHKSEPLGKFLPPALKLSDNLVFDSLYLSLIHKKNPDSIKDWQNGDKVIKELIKTYFDVGMDKALFVDGSGLSRYNRIQPYQLFKLLQKAYGVKNFVEALSYAGENNSTLKNRKLPKDVRAKTGSMSGISSLCGYKLGETPKVFVFVSNSFAPTIADTNAIIDRFISENLG